MLAREFLHGRIAPGSIAISDGLRSYPLVIADAYGHKPFNIKRPCLCLPGARNASWRPSGGQPAQALAGRHPRVRCLRRASADLPGRVPVSVQPPPLAGARTTVLPPAPGCGHRCTNDDARADQGPEPTRRANAPTGTSHMPESLATTPTTRTTANAKINRSSAALLTPTATTIGPENDAQQS